MLTVLPAVAVPVRVSVLSLVMPSPTVPLSAENETTVGAVGATVSTVGLSAVEAPLTLPAACLAVGREDVTGIGERAGVEGPRPAAIGGCSAEQRGAVVDAHRAPGSRRARQR